MQITQPLQQKAIEKAGLKLTIQKMKIKKKKEEEDDHGIWSHHFMANKWGNNGNSDRLYFLGLQNHCGQ